MFLWFNLILVFSYGLISWWNKKVRNWKCSCDSIWFCFLVMYSWWNKSAKLKMFLWFNLILIFSYVLISWWNKSAKLKMFLWFFDFGPIPNWDQVRDCYLVCGPSVYNFTLSMLYTIITWCSPSLICSPSVWGSEVFVFLFWITEQAILCETGCSG